MPVISTHSFVYFCKRILTVLLDLVLWFTVLVLLHAVIDVSIETGIYVVMPFYHWYMNQSPWQGTLGKKALGLVVVDTAGKRLTPRQSFLYTLSSLLVPFTLGLAFLTILLRTDKRPMHDAIANVFVVNK